MARRADHQPMLKFFKVLLPCCLQNLRVPGKVARVLGDGDGDGDGDGAGAGAGAVLVAGALGKVWRVEVRRERGGGGKEEGDEEKAFLARGWAEFSRAHGLGVGWFLVFRHEGRGVLSVKAFDTSLCLREFGTPCTGLTSKNIVAARRPQFIRILLPGFSTKLRIPPKFARNHIKNDNASQMALVLSPLGKFWRVELKHDQSYVFLGSGWAEFLMAHDLSRGNLLLFRYEGNMVFTVKVFELSGCEKEYCDAAPSVHIADEKALSDMPQEKNKQPEVPLIGRKRNRESGSASRAGDKKPECSPTYMNKKKAPRHLITKNITARALSHNFILGRSICASNGIPASCTITLKTSAQSKRSWKVTFRTANTYSYFKSGWKEFCRDNKVTEGDKCTFHVVETSLWHVSIRSSTPS